MFLPSVELGRGERGAEEPGGGLRASSQPRGLRPYGASASPALYCTPCCFNQWQACSQDNIEQRLLHCVSRFFFCMFFFFLMCRKLLHLTLRVLDLGLCLVDRGVCLSLYAGHLLIYFI